MSVGMLTLALLAFLVEYVRSEAYFAVKYTIGKSLLFFQVLLQNMLTFLKSFSYYLIKYGLKIV